MFTHSSLGTIGDKNAKDIISSSLDNPFKNKDFTMGSFTNYVDQFVTYFDHLPTYRGLSWTFGALPTTCPRGHRKPWPPTFYNFYWAEEDEAIIFKFFSGLLTNLIDKSCKTMSEIYRQVQSDFVNISCSEFLKKINSSFYFQ